MTSSVLQAHPLLDPNLAEHRPSVLRYLYQRSLAIERSPESYNRFLNSLLHPYGDDRLLEANLVTSAYYMHEATHYVREVLEMLPVDEKRAVTPRSEVIRCSDMRELLSIIYSSRDRRLAFEAQRKLCLTKLFFDIDHSWEVQRGGEHKAFLEEIVQAEVFSHVMNRRHVDINYGVQEDGVTMDYGEGEVGNGEERWSFDLKQIEMLREGRPIRIHSYYYACRFKREVVPYQYMSGQGRYEFGLSEMFPGMSKRRSASIASKMIRKGENDPRAIQDLVGLMFIVENLSELEDLKELLFDVFGGFFRFKNVVDTVTAPEDQSLLNPQSANGYKVYKAELDVLYNPPGNRSPMPYTFNAEIQLYTLENYLRTLHTSHYANHQSLKRRQFLEGIVPHLFPEEVYGPITMGESFEKNPSGNVRIVGETSTT